MEMEMEMEMEIEMEIEMEMEMEIEYNIQEGHPISVRFDLKHHSKQRLQFNQSLGHGLECLTVFRPPG